MTLVHLSIKHRETLHCEFSPVSIQFIVENIVRLLNIFCIDHLILLVIPFSKYWSIEQYDREGWIHDSSKTSSRETDTEGFKSWIWTLGADFVFRVASSRINLCVGHFYLTAFFRGRVEWDDPQFNVIISFRPTRAWNHKPQWSIKQESY